MKTKQKCKSCGIKYDVLPIHRQFQNWCSYDCHIVITIKKQKEAAARKKAKEHKKSKNDVVDFKQFVFKNSERKQKAAALVTAQNNFNRYIRMRDLGQPCISCQRHYVGKWNAGHYKSVGANLELRFEPLNCHLQCEPCNTSLSGNIIEYRKNLLLKIGGEKLAWLEGPHKIPKLTIHDIKEFSEKYKILAYNMTRI